MSDQINKAWWIAQVKEHGSGGGITYLAEKASMPYVKAKPAIDLLVATSLIRMEPVGKRYRYSVTTLGHRYLNEHQDELEADDLTPPAAQDNAEPMRPIKVDSLPAAIRRDEAPSTPVSTEPSPAGGFLVQAPADQRALKDALYEIMYEKFADQVTARELMERLAKRSSA